LESGPAVAGPYGLDGARGAGRLAVTGLSEAQEGAGLRNSAGGTDWKRRRYIFRFCV